MHNQLDDNSEVEADLRLLESIRWSRKAVEDRLCTASASQDEAVLGALRLDAAHQFVEFFFLLQARGLTSVEQIEAFANLHNNYIIELTKDRAKMRRLGVRHDRLLDAMFTADTMPRLLQNWREQPGAIDQSNLARFLVVVMSTETCRKLAIACDAAGFLTRSKTPYGTILVASTGVMETIYGEVLRELRRRLIG